MTRPPDLTDRASLARNRARARKAPALFLHEAALSEVKERLNEVNRTFTAPAVITAFPEIWGNLLPKARLLPDDDLLALDVGAHDLVVHALCLHWAADPVGQLVQARRALRPDGLFLAVLFGGQTLAELRASLAQAESELTGGLSPRVLPMGEIRDLGALLQRAGFALPVADSATLNASYRDLRHLAADLRAMGEGNALAARNRRVSRQVFDRAQALYAAHFPAEGGRMNATFEMIFLTGWAPDESQPKPLRPGSASARLADALGTSETPLPDPAQPPARGGKD